MCKNRVLSTAVAVALSVGLVDTAMAGTMALTSPTTTAPKFAAEIFNPLGDNQAIPSSTSYIVEYTFGSNISDDFTMDFELTGGTRWGNPGTTTTWFDSSAGKLLAGALSCNIPGLGITVQSGGTINDSTVKFLVQASKQVITAGANCSFLFKMSNAAVLGNAGGEVKLQASLPKTLTIAGQGIQYADTTQEVTLATSDNGVTISFPPRTPSGGFPMVDVNNQSLTFTGGDEPEKPNTAVFGIIAFASGASTSVVDISGTTAWTFGTSDPLPISGSLVVDNGNFAASKADPGKVFIDISTSGSNKRAFDTSGQTYKDLAPSDLTDAKATWTLTAEQVKYLGPSGPNTGTTEVVLISDGTNAINTFSDEPTVSLFVKYPTRDYSQTGAFRHIKSNGTVCTLYNIPNPSAVDTLSVKITNNSNKTANLYGTLIGKDGTELFRNKPLDPATIEPNQTVRIDAAGLKTAGELTEDWAGRAVLTVTSDITNNNMSVSGLVRNSQGGPLMNMSVGATGNGCQ